MTKQKIVCGIAMLWVLAMSSLTSCSRDLHEGIVPEEFGTLKLGVATGNGFEKQKGRAVDESAYAKVANYKVQIKQDGSVVKEFPSAASLPASIELENGSYTVEASYGSELPKSREVFLSKGSQQVNVQANTQAVQLTCEPTCAKVKVNFGADMDKYFSDYKVSFYTEALKLDAAVWAKGDTDPWYLLVNKAGEEVSAKIELTAKAAYTIPGGMIIRSYTLSPNKGWTLNVNPKYNASNGQLGLTITIDTSTNDHEVDIVVPSDWVTATSIN